MPGRLPKHRHSSGPVAVSVSVATFITLGESGWISTNASGQGAFLSCRVGRHQQAGARVFDRILKFRQNQVRPTEERRTELPVACPLFPRSKRWPKCWVADSIGEFCVLARVWNPAMCSIQARHGLPRLPRSYRLFRARSCVDLTAEDSDADREAGRVRF